MEQAKRGLSRKALALLGLAALVGLIVWWRILTAVLVMVLCAALFAALLAPLATRLERRMRPGAAAGLSILLLTTTLLLFLGLVLPLLLHQAGVLLEQLPRLLSEFDARAARLSAQLEGSGLPPLPSLNAAMARWDASNLLQGVMDGVGSAAGRLTQWALVPVIGFYFLRDRENVSYRLALLIPIAFRRRALWVAAETRRALMAYLRGQLQVTLVTGVLTALGLLLLGVPGWLAFGGWMALCDLIPYFGPFLGAIPVVLFGATMGWQRMLWALGIVVIVQQVEANVLSPRFIGDQTGMHPVTVLLSLAIGNMVLGFWGMLLSLPVVVAVRAVVRALQAAG